MHLLCQGNALRLPLADRSVHMCITSPPYWGLRDYGTASWDGGDPACDHKELMGFINPKNTLGPAGHLPETNSSSRMHHRQYRAICAKCGARRIDSQLGLEPTPDEYIAKMVAVFREVWRVLRDDGTCWVNMGDSYISHGWGSKGNENKGNSGSLFETDLDPRRYKGVKPKDLVGIPWRLAFALQASGWYLRSDIIWSKPNPMPESVTDRPTKSHEYLFLLSKSERYYFDAEAVRELSSRSYYEWTEGGNAHYKAAVGNANSAPKRDVDRQDKRRDDLPAVRNIRSVWTIPTEAYPGSHFATFPRKLVEPCIKAGTSERGCCPVCGKPWERVVESERVATRPGNKTKILVPTGWNTGPGRHDGIDGRYRGASEVGNRDPGRHVAIKTDRGWRHACNCHHMSANWAPVPAVVFDPFVGSGTVCVVANALGRHGIGLDLSADYLKLASQRITRPHAAIQRPGREESHPLFDRES